MRRKSQEIIGRNVDIPATTEFEGFPVLGIEAKLMRTLQKQSSENFQKQALILTDSQGG
jgi:hypothetical protein